MINLDTWTQRELQGGLATLNHMIGMIENMLEQETEDPERPERQAVWTEGRDYACTQALASLKRYKTDIEIRITKYEE